MGCGDASVNEIKSLPLLNVYSSEGARQEILENFFKKKKKKQQSRLMGRKLFGWGGLGKPLQNKGMEQVVWKTRGRSIEALGTAGAKALRSNLMCSRDSKEASAAGMGD